MRPLLLKKYCSHCTALVTSAALPHWLRRVQHEAIPVLPRWLCPALLAVPALPIQVQGGQGGGRGVSAPHPDSCTCVDAFICPLRQHILRELVQLPHALRRLDIIAYFDCHVIHGRAVQRTFCSESLSTPEQITRQAYARTTWLKRSASTTPNKQKSIMRVLIC